MSTRNKGGGGQEKLVNNNVVRASHQPKLRFPLNMVPCFVLLARCDFDEIQKKGQKVIERTRKGERDKETERQRDRETDRQTDRETETETEKPDQKEEGDKTGPLGCLPVCGGSVCMCVWGK